MSDERKFLLSEARKGNIEAFEKLMEPYYKGVYSLALKAAVSSDAASRLAQEVFVRLSRSLEQISEGNLSVQVYRMAAEVCTHRLKLRQQAGMAAVGRVT